MPETSKASPHKPLAQYSIAVGVVAGAFLLRFSLVKFLGLQLPPFITLYPAVIIVALWAGLWPGLLATALAALGTNYLVLDSRRHLGIPTASDAVTLALYAGMGVFMNLLAERYRRSQRSVAEFKAHQVLRESEVLYRNLFNSMDEGFCVIDVLFDPHGKPVDFRFIEVNASYERQTRIPNPTGKRMREIAPDLENYWFELYGKVALTGEPAHVLNEAKAIDGYYDVRAYRIGEPELRRVAVVFSEISARMREEKALREQADLIDLAHDTIMTRDLDGTIRFWNHGGAEMYGFSREQATGRISHELLRTVFPQPLAEIETRVLEKDRWEGELIHTARNGARIVVDSRWALQRDKDGAPIAVMEINNDISERKRAETELLRKTEALMRSNKELDEFAYAASHDLKAPLRVIDNASKWLEEDLAPHLTAETRANMTLLRGRVQRLAKLLDDLLEYARIGRKTDKRYAEVLTGAALMEDILELLAPPPEFTVKTSSTLAAIQVSRMPLQQILINLIGNAIKHHDKKTGCIEVSVEDLTNHLEFAIRDDGPGIPSQFHEKIFELFQTLKPRDQIEGSGMGLTMVRKYVESCGGKITLESAEGQGTTFRFTWPKQQQMEPDTG